MSNRRLQVIAVGLATCVLSGVSAFHEYRSDNGDGTHTMTWRLDCASTLAGLAVAVFAASGLRRYSLVLLLSVITIAALALSLVTWMR